MHSWLLIALLLAVPSSGMAQSAADLDRKTYIETISANPTAEQVARKARSTDILQAMDVPVLESLPVIASEAQSTRKDSRAVAQRALALMIVAVKGETGNTALTQAVIEQYDAAGVFTAAEQAFIDDLSPGETTRAAMAWRYESVAVLLWSIGLLDTLPPPDQIIDASLLGTTLRDLGADGLYAKARLRPQSDLLDATDLAYRMNWAVTEARVTGKPPPGAVLPGIAYERHYALNWLIGYAGLDWDNMRTDT